MAGTAEMSFQVILDSGCCEDGWEEGRKSAFWGEGNFILKKRRTWRKVSFCKED